ncbi:MAG: ABC transporter permease [Planctomycetes bacterium]|nr:ABC transporter permease [Planctomycetota bacterium]
MSEPPVSDGGRGPGPPPGLEPRLQPALQPGLQPGLHADEAVRAPRRISEVGLQVIGITVLLAVLVFITWLRNPNILGAYNLQTLSRDIAILSLFALGQGIVIIAGGIDLSVGSIICFIGLNAILFQTPDGFSWPLAAVLPLALAFTVGVGVAHGFLTCRLGLQPFMVTLCSLLVFRSVARGITGDYTVAFRKEDLPAFHWLGNGIVLGVPVPVWTLAIAAAALLFFMHFTVHGRYLYAIGYNLEAARFSGVRVHSLRVFTFALSGLLAGVSGLLEASNIQSVSPSTAGMAYELHGITAAVLGGCALRGGQGSIVGIIVGAAILKVLQRMIVFLGLETHWTDAVIGVVLLCAVIADALVKRRRGI